MLIDNPDLWSTADSKNFNPRRLACLAFVISALCFMIGLSDVLPDTLFQTSVVVVGAGTCGWSWVLTRLIFKKGLAPTKTPLAITLFLYVTAGFSSLATASQGSGVIQPETNISAALYNFVGVAALIFGALEAASDIRKNMPSIEKRFRLIYSGLFVSLVFTSAILVRSIGSPDTVPSVLIACCVAGICIAIGATVFRELHPLGGQKNRKASVKIEDSLADAAQKVLGTIQEERIFTQRNLKVASLAEMIGEPEYRVSQAITSVLGFSNFNQMINHYRIKRVSKILSDPANNDIPILTIALDSGFSSIGPFNRAFKENMGMTPSAYRGQ